MDHRLLEAAKTGDTEALGSLLREEPEALDKVCLLFGVDTPLHIATLSGKTHFAKAVIELNPGFVWETNQNGLTPLHLACALGHDDIVDAILHVGPGSLCLVRDNKGRVPLHYAAITGKVGIIEKLLSKCPETLKVVTDRRETCLHLALVNKQVDALQKLLDRVGDDAEMLGAEDERGHTINDLAEGTDQFRLLSSLTTRGKSPFAIFKHSWYSPNTFPIDADMQCVIASLVATVTFQAVANPPPSIWKEDVKMDYTCLSKVRKHHRRERETTICPPFLYLMFMASNTLGFLCSTLLIIAFRRTSLANNFLVLSISSLIGSYAVLAFAMAPDTIAVASTFVAPLILCVMMMPILRMIQGGLCDYKLRQTESRTG